MERGTKQHSKYTILVIDDSESRKNNLNNTLNQHYNVLFSSDFLSAREMMEKHYVNLALLYIDIDLLINDDFSFLIYLKENEKFKSIPIIIQTRNNKSKAEERALTLGANEFFREPYNINILLLRFNNIISSFVKSSYIKELERDNITKLYRKQSFHQVAREYLDSYPDTKFKVISTNICNFISINDLFGHDIGDMILKEIAKLIEEKFYPFPVGRIGADNFSTIVPQSFTLDEQFVNEFNSQLNKQLIFNIEIVVKMGVFYIQDRNVSLAQMCDRALVSIQDIKYQYDRRVAYYDDKMRQKIFNEHVIINSMEEALRDGEFEVYYQPKYDLINDCYCGAEALVRWNSKDRGLMQPMNFIPIFERTGFIYKLDCYVFATVCRHIKEWICQGKIVKPISVNISRFDFYNSSLIKDLTNIISLYSIPINLVHLEITESDFTMNNAFILKVVQKMKEYGFIVEMDDFGTGYSSLNMLSTLPIDYLKLDMKFVQEGLKSLQSRTIIQFIITLSKWLDLKVVAEGIENKDQELLLKEMGCEYGQGYLYSKPVPKSQFEAIIYTDLHNNNQLYSATHDNAVQDFGMQNLPAMMVISSDSLDKLTFNKIFDKQFNVLFESDIDVAIDYLKNNSNKVKIIILNFDTHEYSNTLIIGKIKKHKMLVNIPIVVAVTLDKVAEVDALLIGADDVLIKPFVSVVTKKRILNVINSKYMQNKYRQKLNYSLVNIDPQTGQLSSLALFNYFARIKNEKNNKDRGFILLTIDDLDYQINTHKANYLQKLFKDLFNLINLTLSNENLYFKLATNQIGIVLENISNEVELEECAKKLKLRLEKCSKMKVRLNLSYTLFNTKDDYLDVINRLYNR